MRGILAFFTSFLFVMAQEALPPPPPPPPAEGEEGEYYPTPPEVERYLNYRGEILGKIFGLDELKWVTRPYIYYPFHSRILKVHPGALTVIVLPGKVDRVYASFTSKLLEGYENLVILQIEEDVPAGNLVIIYEKGGKRLLSIPVVNAKSGKKGGGVAHLVVVKEGRKELSEREKVSVIEAFIRMYQRYPKGEIVFVYNGERYLISEVTNPYRGGVIINGRVYDVRLIEVAPEVE